MQREFLNAISELGTLSAAAKAVNIDRKSHYLWLETDEEYAERWEDAQEQYTEKLEREAGRRAVEGQDVGVYFQGQKVGVEKRPSDILLMFLLKARKPIYRDRTEITGANGGPLTVQAMRPDALSRLTDAQLDALAALNGMAPAALSPAPSDLVGELARDDERAAQDAAKVSEADAQDGTFAHESEALKAKG